MSNGIKIGLSNDKCHFYSISYDIDNVLLDKTLFGVPEAVSQQAMTASLHPGFEECEGKYLRQHGKARIVPPFFL